MRFHKTIALLAVLLLCSCSAQGEPMPEINSSVIEEKSSPVESSSAGPDDDGSTESEEVSEALVFESELHQVLYEKILESLSRQRGYPCSPFQTIQESGLASLGIEASVPDSSLQIEMPTNFLFTLELKNDSGEASIPLTGSMSYYYYEGIENRSDYKHTIKESLRTSWGGLSVLDDRRFAVFTQDGVVVYSVSNLSVEDTLSLQKPGMPVGIVWSEEYGYLLAQEADSGLTVQSYNHDGIPDKEWLLPVHLEKINLDQVRSERVVGTPLREYSLDLKMDRWPGSISSVENCLDLGGVYLNLETGEWMSGTSSWVELADTDEGMVSVRALSSSNGEEYIEAVRAQDDKIADSYRFPGKPFPNRMLFHVDYEETFVAEPLSNGAYRFSSSESDWLEIILDFTNQIGTIQYLLDDESANEYIDSSPSDRYAAYSVWSAGAGDGFWYDIAVKDRDSGIYTYLGHRGDYVCQEVQFVGDDAFLFKNDMTFYRTSDFSPIRKVTLEKSGRGSISLRYDSQGSRFIDLSAYKTLNDFGWVGYYDTDYYVDVYDDSGRLISSFPTGITCQDQSLYVVIPPEVRMEGDWLKVLHYDRVTFSINVITGEVQQSIE